MPDRLDELVTKLQEDRLSEDERALLKKVLSTEEGRRRYVDLVKVDYCLRERRLEAPARSLASATRHLHTVLSETASRRSRPYEPPRSRGSRSTWALGGAALAAAASLTLWWGVPAAEDAGGPARRPTAPVEVAVSMPSEPSAETPETSAFAARLVGVSVDTKWGEGGSPSDFLMRLNRGQRLSLASGMAQVEFAGGALVTLTAPADLEVMGPAAARLRSGKLYGHCEKGDFIVHTPGAEVVDIGTQFGVAIGDREVTDVVVYDGEVHVRGAAGPVKLTKGMSLRVDGAGSSRPLEGRDLPVVRGEITSPSRGSLGERELSLVDILCGSAPGEHRLAAAIDPETGAWNTLPWSEAKGVRSRVDTGKLMPVDWNPWVCGIVAPDHASGHVLTDPQGGSVQSPKFTGGAWGPVWARRCLDPRIDPLTAVGDGEVEGFWGPGATAAMLDRSRWARDGLVGMHANVGVTIDLEAIRKGWGASLASLRGMVAHLERSHASQPFQPQAKSDFRVYVDGKLRYERIGFRRLDGDAQFGAELSDDDHYLTLLVTDASDGPVYDRVILVDPVLELTGD